MTNTQRTRLKWRIFSLITCGLLISQYQNCARVENSVGSSDPSFTATPIAGSVSNGAVKTITQSTQSGVVQVMFVTNALEISNLSTMLVPAGVCTQVSDLISWSIEDTSSGLVLNQGELACSQGSFHLNLTTSLSELQCGRSYKLSANLQSSTDQMIISKQCDQVASN